MFIYSPFNMNEKTKDAALKILVDQLNKCFSPISDGLSLDI